MLTSQLFELWGIDDEILLHSCQDHGSGSAVVLGGSLADNMGTPVSDIDVYCFSDATRPDGQHAFRRLNERVVHIHTVNRTTLGSLGGPLWQLLDEPQCLDGVPVLPPTTLSDLHALQAGRALYDDGTLEQLRVDSGSDLLGSYLVLRNLVRTRRLLQRLKDGPGAPAKVCVRGVLEATTDTCLAAIGLVNPNPKWRVELLSRAPSSRPDTRWTDAMVEALRAGAPDDPAGQLALAGECLADVFEEPTVRLLVAQRAGTQLLSLMDDVRKALPLARNPL
ncbi:nucleotidyltransferase domain-containing protein [Streptomyces prunicolor]|uniref:nucleotidyltransferase domain-containing protein n=1 Tax=Streptomyces prunicolor TaxID=67348 RepID=UPI00341B0116